MHTLFLPSSVRPLRLAVMIALAGSTASAAAACYTVFQADQTIYQSTVSPVDLSRPLSDTVPQRFGSGASMAMRQGDGPCPELGEPFLHDAPVAATAATASTANSRQSGSQASRASAAAHILEVGPRGGVFYVNSNGNKTYVSRSAGRGR